MGDDISLDQLTPEENKMLESEKKLAAQNPALDYLFLFVVSISGMMYVRDVFILHTEDYFGAHAWQFFTWLVIGMNARMQRLRAIKVISIYNKLTK